MVSNILAKIFPKEWKKYFELRYWKNQKAKEDKFSNGHYKFFYTEHFGLGDKFYECKKILDIECGPRGSLEWATMSKKRIGLDPLAESYLKLGADEHQMEYCSSPSEKIPFPEAYFDVVCSFNSLDHVSNVNESISVIKRITKSNDLFLLLVEINHEPTNCEPYKFGTDIIKRFSPQFKSSEVAVYKALEKGLYDSVKAANEYSDINSVTEQAWLSAKFKRR